MTSEKTPEESGSWKPNLTESSKGHKTSPSALNSGITTFRGVAGTGARTRSPPVCSVFYAAFCSRI